MQYIAPYRKRRVRTNYKAARQPLYNLIAEAKRRAVSKNLPFGITQKDIFIPKNCPILGIPLQHGVGKLCENSPTLDRIVPELGYIPSNVRVVSYKANTIKSFGTAQEHLAIAKYILENSNHVEINNKRTQLTSQ